MSDLLHVRRGLGHDAGMTPLFGLAVALAAAAPGSQACTPDTLGAGSRAAAAAYIQGAEAEWAASVSRNEAAFLKRMTAQGFVAVLGGKVFTREALIAEAAERGAGAASDRLESVRVHVTGSIAVAEGVEVWTDYAPYRRTRIIWSDIWLRCGGSWRLMNTTSASLPAD